MICIHNISWTKKGEAGEEKEYEFTWIRTSWSRREQMILKFVIGISNTFKSEQKSDGRIEASYGEDIFRQTCTCTGNHIRFQQGRITRQLWVAVSKIDKLENWPFCLLSLSETRHRSISPTAKKKREWEHPGSSGKINVNQNCRVCTDLQVFFYSSLQEKKVYFVGEYRRGPVP